MRSRRASPSTSRHSTSGDVSARGSWWSKGPSHRRRESPNRFIVSSGRWLDAYPVGAWTPRNARSRDDGRTRFRSRAARGRGQSTSSVSGRKASLLPSPPWVVTCRLPRFRRSSTLARFLRPRRVSSWRLAAMTSTARAPSSPRTRGSRPLDPCSARRWTVQSTSGPGDSCPGSAIRLSEPFVHAPHAFEEQRLGRLIDDTFARAKRGVERELAIHELDERVERHLSTEITPKRVDHVALDEMNLARAIGSANPQVARLSAVEKNLDHVGQPHLAKRAAHPLRLSRARALIEKCLELGHENVGG